MQIFHIFYILLILLRGIILALVESNPFQNRATLQGKTRALAISTAVNITNPKRKTVPDVFVIGAMRVGTTLLYDLLRHQQGISVARMKETDAYLTDSRAARASALNQRQFGDSADVWVDISPNYTKRHAFPGVAARIQAANPEARFIYLVRNPVKRSQSHLQHIAVSKAGTAESVLSANEINDVIKTSLYHWQIQPFLKRFPRDRFLFINFEDFIRQPSAYTCAIRDHLGGPDSFSLPDTLNTPSNTIMQLKQMPSWWAPLRRSSLGGQIREFLPRSMINLARSMVRSRSTPSELPKLGAELRKRVLKECLSDIPKFQHLTGLDTSHWLDGHSNP